MSKYNNRKVELDGYKFDSAAEARRYLWLKDELEQGNIMHLHVHYPFELAPRHVATNKQTGKREVIRAVVHEVDFSYLTKDGRDIVEDVKGVRTAVWRLKYNLFRRSHPRFEYHVIEAKDC